MVTVEEYSRTVQVASYEVGANEKIKLSVLLRMAQETSEQHLGELGIGYERLKADGIVFLMTNYRLLIKRLPVHNDVLTIKTHPRGTVGVQFYRDFVVYADGEEIARIMQEEGYVAGYEVVEGEPRATLEITLKYGEKKAKTIRGIRRISKPGLRIYAGKDELPRVLGGLGTAIVSTSNGVMTDRDARKKGIGGEVIAYIW